MHRFLAAALVTCALTLPALHFQLRHLAVERRTLLRTESQTLWNLCSTKTTVREATIVEDSLAIWALMTHKRVVWPN